MHWRYCYDNNGSNTHIHADSHGYHCGGLASNVRSPSSFKYSHAKYISNTSLIRLDTTQYNLFECSDTSGLKTPTPLTLNTCVITDRSLSDNFGEFIGGACTPDECFVNFYGDAQCSSAPITAGVSVTDTTCFDFEFVYAAMLLCPTCPHS